MTDPALTREQVEAILAGCDGVTPGPWRSDNEARPHKRDDPFSEYGASIEANNPRAPWLIVGGMQDEQGGAVGVLSNHDAAHIARLDPATVSALCDSFLEAERLREENARLRAILELHADVLARQAGPALDRARAALSKE